MVCCQGCPRFPKQQRRSAAAEFCLSVCALHMSVCLQNVMHSVLGSDLIKAFMAVRHCEVQQNPQAEALLLRY